MRTDATIAIVGGGALVSEALALMLTRSGNRVLGSYGDVHALEAALGADTRQLQAVVIDAEDPRVGPAAVAAVRRSYSDLKIVLLCEAASRAVIACAISEHVEGVVLKSDTPEDLILALRNVLAGRAVMPASWHRAPLEREAEEGVLSARELEVLDLAAAGLTNQEIAERLMISTNTVKFHLRGIYSSLGVHNRVQASQALSLNHRTTGEKGRRSGHRDTPDKAPG